MSKKITHDWTCDDCGEPATKIIEQVWNQCKIFKNGNFGKDNIGAGVDCSQHFFCDEHDY